MRELFPMSKLILKYYTDLQIGVVALLYFVSAWLGHSLAFTGTTALSVWPPSGMAFALLVLMGRSVWPGITIGALAANLLAFWNTQGLSQQWLIGISVCIAIGQTGEALTGRVLLTRWIKDSYPFNSTRDTFRFLFASVFMCVIGSGTSSLSLWAAGIINTNTFGDYFLHAWIGSGVGILLFTPLILAVARQKHITIHPPKLIEGCICIASLIGLSLLVRFGYFNNTLINSLPFLLIPFLLWLAFRFNLVAAMAVALSASLIAIYFTVQQVGPFVQILPLESMLFVQIFIGVISISTIVLSATVSERTLVQDELRKFNSNLEAMVQQRTQALNQEINTRKLTEAKLLQTNQELSKRNTELDNFVYSVSHDLRAPIASVLGLINLARKDNDPAMKNEYLNRINTSAMQQDDFIREILDQSRNARLDVKKEEIFFEPLIEETFNQLKYATTTSTSLEKIVNIHQTEAFHSDRWRLKVVLNNIISNAIRYRNGREPVIRVNVAIDKHKALIEVEDNGRGIGREHLARVFDMFYRATDVGAGSGLGLYIVKETLEKLQGQIKIESEEGRGTLVRLEIPELA
ncbi:MAG: MASE1 domain-containing protein [Cyclobacteriaceae bacterium]|nr:MASE1 domain-containing protein [Cyclobacteriaceae bacterium]